MNWITSAGLGKVVSVLDQGLHDPLPRGLDLAPQTGCGGGAVAMLQQLDQLLVLAAHLGREVAEVQAEQEEALHGSNQIRERGDQPPVARECGQLEVKILVAGEEVRIRCPVVKGVLGGCEGGEPLQLARRRAA
jgi:hypothetical protein